VARSGFPTIEGDTLTADHAGCRVTVKLAPDGRGRFRPVSVHIEGAVTAEAVRTLPLRAYEADANSRMGQFVLRASAALGRQPALKFELPSGPGRKPDAFYRKVALAYQWLSVMGRGPAAELARINGVPVTTVHRWTKEARARGLLAPGQKGRAS
jgi:hypothetical protein